MLNEKFPNLIHVLEIFVGFLDALFFFRREVDFAAVFYFRFELCIKLRIVDIQMLVDVVQGDAEVPTTTTDVPQRCEAIRRGDECRIAVAHFYGGGIHLAGLRLPQGLYVFEERHLALRDFIEFVEVDETEPRQGALGMFLIQEIEVLHIIRAQFRR